MLHLKNTQKIPLCDKIRKLKSTNPRDYGALLKNCNKKQNESVQLNIDALYEHFSDLNKNRHAETLSLDELISIHIVDSNPLLNSDFTYEEVQKAIAKFKNNKSCGTDQILNEYMKKKTSDCIKLYIQYRPCFNAKWCTTR